MSVGERRKLEEEVDKQVDSVPIPLERGQTAKKLDDLPVQIQKCAERMLGESTASAHRSLHTPKTCMPPPPVPLHRAGMGASGGSREQSGGSASSANPAPLTKARSPTVQVHFSCVVNAPKDWVLGQVLEHIRRELKPENCVLSSPPHQLSIQMRVDSTAAADVVIGGGRSLRVQRDTVALNALAHLLEDLKQFGCESIESTLLKNLLLRDRKCAMAVFQARSQRQRLQATAAALSRLGLPDKTAEIALLIPRATVDDDLSKRTLSAKMPGRSGYTGGASDMGLTVDSVGGANFGSQTNEHTSKLEGRIMAIEAWAHSLDAQLESDDGLADKATFKARELLDAMALQAVKDARTDREEILEQQVLALASRIDRLCLVHNPDADDGCQHVSRAANVEKEEDSDVIIRLTVLEKKMQECLISYGELIRSREDIDVAQRDSAAHEVDVVSTEVKFASLENKVDLCMRLCQTQLQQRSCADASLATTLQSQSVEIRRMSELMAMHTAAISRTWQWTASAVQAITALQRRGDNTSAGRSAQVKAQERRRDAPGRARNDTGGPTLATPACHTADEADKSTASLPTTVPGTAKRARQDLNTEREVLATLDRSTGPLSGDGPRSHCPTPASASTSLVNTGCVERLDRTGDLLQMEQVSMNETPSSHARGDGDGHDEQDQGTAQELSGVLEISDSE
eukprot:2159583-Amphidinium_carterae.2